MEPCNEMIFGQLAKELILFIEAREEDKADEMHSAWVRIRYYMKELNVGWVEKLESPPEVK